MFHLEFTNTAEAQKEAIRKEARLILEGFAKTLEKASASTSQDKAISSGRKEGQGKGCEEDFRRRMFANAPKKNEDCIIAEKGAWAS